MDLRRQARVQNDHRNEQRLHKEVRKAFKLDRTSWLDRMLEEGDWHQIRNLPKPRRARCHRLKNASGDFVESDEWADTMAAHMKTIQWRVRPMGLLDAAALGGQLPVNVQEFTEGEVEAAVRKLKRRQASGPDEIPA